MNASDKTLILKRVKNLPTRCLSEGCCGTLPPLGMGGGKEVIRGALGVRVVLNPVAEVSTSDIMPGSSSYPTKGGVEYKG